ncbi:MAG: indolepyruvate oxidoreductase subunit beta [candidate division Zixibacteria bacterium]|jgi:indolepyruvate ferredoxin oxidoreductase beta subunit|nr:indolepyruvate oxidoreductase subunit beta [candidate division Zixibacteria bacterium]
MTNETTQNILIVGVGGQGVLLASEIISAAAMNGGLDVKKSEVHGMSQRGGVVSSHVRLGPRVYSPVIEYGQADILMAFEQAEGLRAIDWMRSDGVAVISLTRLVPAIVTSSKAFHYPEDPIADMRRKAKHVIAVSADKIAAELGNPRLVNTILLGVCSNYMPFPTELWQDMIRMKVKDRFVDINLQAFARGREVKLAAAGA